MDPLMCPICDLKAFGEQMLDQDAYGFKCSHCGEFIIESLLMSEFQAKSTMLAQADRDLVPYLSAHTRQSPRTNLSRGNWRALAQARKAVPFKSKWHNLLVLLHSRAPHAGALVTLDLDLDAPLLDAGSVEEADFLLNHLLTSGYLARGPIYDTPAYSITGKGVEYLESEVAALGDTTTAKEASGEQILDSLTGLLARGALDGCLNDAVARCITDAVPISAAFLDLDNFKAVNDSLGHPAGDEVLRAIGLLINGVVGGRGMIAGRYGGDEFVIAAPNCTVAEVRAVAERLSEAIARDSRFEPSPGLRVGCSVGIACLHGNETDSSADLIAAADRACYDAKHAGKGRVAVCSDRASLSD